jgi:hypothetical protein
MRRDAPLALACAGLLVAGCGNVDGWSGLKRQPETQPVPVIDDAQNIAEYLTMLDRMGGGGPAVQAEILEATRNAYLTDPSTRNRLSYAFVLAVPGHVATDAEGARRLLGEALAVPETLLESERALAQLMVRELDARLALSQENAALRDGTTTGERDRVASLSRRLQQETAEKERLRRELAAAQAKLEAIATIEGGRTP